MKNYLLILATSLISNLSFCQGAKTIFVDYDKVLYDLNKKGKASIYFKELDYESMLLLDYDFLKVLVKLDPDYVKEKSMILPTYKQQLKGDYTKHYQPLFLIDIKTLFLDQSTLKLILQATWGNDLNLDYQLYKKIYIKEPDKAVFTIFGNSWDKTFRLILKDGLVTLELISETIE